MINFHD